MRILGGLSLLILLQLIFLVFFLFAVGRLPERELSLLWNAIRTGKSITETEKDSPSSPAELAPEERPSLEQQLQALTLANTEIQRKKTDAEGLLKLAERRLAEAESARKEVNDLIAKLKKTVQTEKEKLADQGLQTVVAQIEVMRPEQAKEFLLFEGKKDETTVLRILKMLDPVLAAKVFKEFKQQPDQDKLNGWLAKVSEGEPEISQLPNPPVQ